MRLRTLLVLLPALLLAGASARAFDFFDDRLSVNGYYEAQIRALARDFNGSDDWDLSQFSHVLNLEIEADIAPEGFGPFEFISAQARVEVRHDCIFRRACGLLSSADAYGDRVERLPARLGDGRRSGFTGAQLTGDTRRYLTVPRTRLGFGFLDQPAGQRDAGALFNTATFSPFFESRGLDGMLGTPDDPAPFYLSRYLGSHCRFGNRAVAGPENGSGRRDIGPLDPACDVEPLAALADKPNPFRPGDFNPITGGGGSLALPFRPAPTLAFGDVAGADQARGLWIPNAGLARELRKGGFDDFDQNFDQNELAWNRGASQEDEKELRELYVDLEAFDSKLWIRAGKQLIVWGKTELFRNQDQWNPVDLAFPVLSSLEETRIPLWALRTSWSVYELGPVSDVRFELAVGLDDFEPNDLGRCGEPYSPLLVCDKLFGLLAHGATGLGLAGESRPEDPWHDSRGFEVGGRVEWRWRRFSFSLSDFYGFQDLPHQEQLFVYSRNVDPTSGRPRRVESDAPCTTDLGDPGGPGVGAGCLTAAEALEEHAANQQIFHLICATTIGFNSLDPQACAQSVFNSQVTAFGSAVVAEVLSNVLAGNPFAESVLTTSVLPGLDIPLVALNPDDCDRYLSDCAALGPGAATLDPSGTSPVFSAAGTLPTLNTVLTAEQEALLGCGPFYGTDCERQGIDLLNTEASVLLQSFATTEGTFGREWNTTDGLVLQPGTFIFAGGPVCTRPGGAVLPGCRGPEDPGWDPAVDGDPRASGPQVDTGHPTADLLQPLALDGLGNPAQRFRNELGALSWNALMVLAALSEPADALAPTIADFDPTDPFRTGACSFAQPQFCSAVQGLFFLTGMRRADTRAGGNGRFGRRDFLWHGGTDFALRYARSNVLGFSMDFAEQRLRTNWSIEASWVNDTPFANNNELDGLSDASTYNLTVSIDRPTFIRFLNPERNFFVNTQWFFQFVDGYQKGFLTDGPFNVLATLTVSTGVLRDRLQPAMTLVWDFSSRSGGVVYDLVYKATDRFSIRVGVAGFRGGADPRPMAVEPGVLVNRTGRNANDDFTENGLSPVRDRDEAFLRVRYSF